MAQSKKSDDESNVIIIKKYANRRLYNTAKSSYVTLDDLCQMVRDGEEFVVRDAKSDQDITRSVLTQIIFEEESKGQNMLPTSFLRQLIQLYGDALQGAVPSYLEASMDTFTRNQENIREQMTTAFAGNPALANFENLTRKNMEWYQNALGMFTPFATAPDMDGEADDAKKTDGKDSNELDALKSQLEAMQEQLSKLAGKK